MTAEGLLYHVIARGNNGQKIFLRRSDYEAFVEGLRGPAALPVLSLRLCFNVEPLPSAPGSKAITDRLYPAIVVNRLCPAV
jgi:hypothetical protein